MIKHLHALYLCQMRRYILMNEVNIVFYLHILTLREISNEQVHTYYKFCIHISLVSIFRINRMKKDRGDRDVTDPQFGAMLTSFCQYSC